jgi:hypothetical protein
VLSLHQSPVTCRNTGLDGNFRHKTNKCYYFHSPGLEFVQLLKDLDGLLFKDKEMVKFSEWHFSWKHKLERMAGNVVIYDVDAVLYVVLSKAEKHVPYGELVGGP